MEERKKSTKLGARSNRFNDDSDDEPPLRFRDQDQSVSRKSDVSMENEGQQLRYLTAHQDLDGRVLQRVEKWVKDGTAVDYFVEGTKVKVSLKDPSQIRWAREKLGLRGRTANNRGSGARGGRGAGNRNDSRPPK